MGGGNTKSKTPAPSYKNGRPSFQGTEAHRMLNGMLYRISDTKSKRWAFYNDSKDYIVHVAVLFDYDSQIQPLGQANAFRIDDPEEGNEDDLGKFLVELDIMPLKTEMFVQGVVTGWKVDTLEARSANDEREYRL